MALRGKAGAKVQYFPGTGIARMINKAGIKERTSGTRAAASSARQAANMGVVKGLGLTRDTNFTMRQIQNASLSGLLAAGAHIREDMDKTPPLIPVDTGALKASFKIIPKNIGKKLQRVQIGWPDETITKKDKGQVGQYAAYVHEMTMPPYGKVKWSRPGSGPKFFELAVKRNTGNISKIVAYHVKTSLGV